jgi:mRNA interferase MazF
MVASSMVPVRGFIYWVDFEPVVGSEQGLLRPALVVQNDIGNEFSTTTIVAPLTSQRPAKRYPFHVWLPEDLLSKPSCVLCEQIRTVSIERFQGGPIASSNGEIMEQVDNALRASLQL